MSPINQNLPIRLLIGLLEAGCEGSGLLHYCLTPPKCACGNYEQNSSHEFSFALSRMWPSQRRPILQVYSPRPYTLAGFKSHQGKQMNHHKRCHLPPGTGQMSELASSTAAASGEGLLPPSPSGPTGCGCRCAMAVGGVPPNISCYPQRHRQMQTRTYSVCVHAQRPLLLLEATLNRFSRGSVSNSFLTL